MNECRTCELSIKTAALIVCHLGFVEKEHLFRELVNPSRLLLVAEMLVFRHNPVIDNLLQFIQVHHRA